jgi:hypothetical protein
VDLYPSSPTACGNGGTGAQGHPDHQRPRTAEAVEAQLARSGLPRDCWDGIATSGEAGIARIKKLAHPTGFIGTDQTGKSSRSRGCNR